MQPPGSGWPAADAPPRVEQSAEAARPIVLGCEDCPYADAWLDVLMTDEAPSQLDSPLSLVRHSPHSLSRQIVLKNIKHFGANLPSKRLEDVPKWTLLFYLVGGCFLSPGTWPTMRRKESRCRQAHRGT